MKKPRRSRTLAASKRSGGSQGASWSESELDAFEASHPEGVSLQEVVEAMREKGEKLTEASFRKYVQLGLLPRSRRVRRASGRRGSRGLYPPTTLRQLVHLKRLMGLGLTIEEIQREFLFVRGDIEALARQLDRVMDALEGAVRRAKSGDDALERAKEAGVELISRLESLEQQLALRAHMDRAAL